MTYSIQIGKFNVILGAILPISMLTQYFYAFLFYFRYSLL